MMIMASPPFSLPAVVIFFVAFALWYFARNSSGSGRKLRTMSAVGLSVCVVCTAALEYPHRELPRISGIPADHLDVIGDSISAGLNPLVSTWTAQMQSATGIAVRNLSRVGATVDDGIRMAAQVTPDDRLVLIGIGGNDLICWHLCSSVRDLVERIFIEVGNARTYRAGNARAYGRDDGTALAPLPGRLRQSSEAIGIGVWSLANCEEVFRKRDKRFKSSFRRASLDHGGEPPHGEISRRSSAASLALQDAEFRISELKPKA